MSSWDAFPTAATSGGLPPGHRVLHRDTVTSTNAVALERASQGETGGLWVVADRQEGGRGRGGRAWSSPPGNLYASHLVRPRCALATAQHLTLVAPVALADAVVKLMGVDAADTTRSQARVPVRLKWPNDLLVGGAKVSGILLESAMSPSVVAGPRHEFGALAIVMGFGLNLASHPDGLDQAATHLAAHGSTAAPGDALRALAEALDHWLAVWNDGAGFAAIRAAWLERAGPLGEPLSVRVSPDPAIARITGTFAGLDETGALLLDHSDGSRSRHIQGDVALGAVDR